MREPSRGLVAPVAEEWAQLTDATMLQVGAIVKPHGLRGDVIVTLTTNRAERVEPGSVLWSAEGRSFVVIRSSPHQGRFIVTFEGVSGIDDAEALRSTELFAPPLEDPDALWIHDLIGSEVVDTTGPSSGWWRASRPTRPVTCWCWPEVR